MKRVLFLSLLCAACAAEPDAPEGGGGAGGGGTDAPVPCDAAGVERCRRLAQACDAAGGESTCVACPLDASPGPDGACLALPGVKLENGYGVQDAPAGFEDADICLSWTLDNAEELFVNAVDIDNDGAWHHSNWLFVPDDRWSGPDGAWPCSSREFDEVSGALAGGVLYAQSTQATREVQRFPEGVVVRIPPWSRVIGSAHILNPGAEALRTEMRMRLWTIPEADVRVKLTPFRLNYRDLHLPPLSSSMFTGTCDLDASHQALFRRPLAMKLHYLLPHTHALGTSMFVDVEGGARDGERLLDAPAYNGEANGKAFDPPVDLAGATGFSFGCTFTNPRDVEVGWGFGDQEMCEVLGYAETELLSDNTVSAGDFLEEREGLQVFTGPCDTMGFRMDHERPGGPPR